jgi:hypothetical protein
MNYLVNEESVIAQDRGIEFLYIDASKNEKTMYAETLQELLVVWQDFWLAFILCNLIIAIYTWIETYFEVRVWEHDKLEEYQP